MHIPFAFSAEISNFALRMTKFTIATVCYNAGSLLQRTIASVEAQDYPAIEHLIVDGNSQDETLAHIHHYQERNSRAKVQHDIVCRSEPDEGLYDAMNKAIRLATGDYILFLNAGDKFHSSSTLSEIAAQVDAVVEENELDRHRRPAVLYGLTDLVDNEGNFLRKRRLSPPEKLTWRDFRNGMLVCHQAFFARLDLARKFLYDNETYRFSADYDWCIRIMREADRLRLPLHNTHLTVADYLSEGLTTKNHKASLLERYDIMSHHYGRFTAALQHAWFVLRAVLKK